MIDSLDSHHRNIVKVYVCGWGGRGGHQESHDCLNEKYGRGNFVDV